MYIPIGYDQSFEGASQHLDPGLMELVGGRRVLTWVGSFWPAFGIEEIVDLAVRFSHRRRDLVFMLVGDGPSRANIVQSLQQCKLANVLMPGRVSLSDLQAYLRISDVFLLPFRAIPQNLYRCPTKLFQYIAYNRPIVTNRVGEIAEALGEAGFYYKPGDIEGMADACETALAGVTNYDRSDLIAQIQWSERARQYRHWLEGLNIAA